MAPTDVRDAERDATLSLQGWWFDDNLQDAPLPVDPFRLAGQFGLAVQKVSLPPNESGKIEFRAEAVVITVNALDHENRQRFTCAHEIGHYVRRRETGSHQSEFVDYRDTLAGMGTDQEEIYANQFAAALLMPAHLVKRWSNEKKPVEDMAARFGTSVQAMNLRLRNLRLT